MTHKQDTAKKARRFSAVVAALALAAALTGCIVVPDGGPRYGYYHPHYWHGRDWR
jgi:hypothetical protein